MGLAYILPTRNDLMVVKILALLTRRFFIRVYGNLLILSNIIIPSHMYTKKWLEEKQLIPI